MVVGMMNSSILRVMCCPEVRPVLQVTLALTASIILLYLDMFCTVEDSQHSTFYDTIPGPPGCVVDCTSLASASPHHVLKSQSLLTVCYFLFNLAYFLPHLAVSLLPLQNRV